ncbi:hypothetical protein DUNSADRAFT_5112 [Dunaliella salina]|uniref:Uncharacterized protein n=1 Tax=Dunaliella salina TaxID=3046 RepID=A0ABQ7HAJ2_DUNSA|nr:hypothetical protein DUNSADRAFT_5112 [Dunaliella salina]|eukprot:KAF5843874.1 hypothetical protein DUNSADRAFT_5112 [Dunaliella salina]
MSGTTGAGNSLASLPTDVLILLLSLVDDPHSLSSFFRSSRMAASLAVDPVLQAKWLTLHRKADAWNLVAQSKRQEVALQLLSCSSGMRNKDGGCEGDYAELFPAAAAGFAQVLRILLGEKQHNTRALGGALCLAARSGHAPCVPVLLAAANSPSDVVEHRDGGGWCSLHYACCRGHEEVLAELLKVPSNVDVVTRLLETPLTKARASGSTRCVQLIMDARKQVQSQDQVFPKTLKQ